MSSLVIPCSFATLSVSSAISRASESAAPANGRGAFSASHCSRNSAARLLTFKPQRQIDLARLANAQAAKVEFGSFPEFGKPIASLFTREFQMSSLQGGGGAAYQHVGKFRKTEGVYDDQPR